MVGEWEWLWVPATLVAAAAQVGRNAIQRSLSGPLGTLGATQVRFLYGFPFAIVFFLAALWLTQAAFPSFSLEFFLYTFCGAVSQILGTALMLAAMQRREFVVVTAWTKTEPIQVALFGVLVLSDPISLAGACAILAATLGVVVLSRPASASAQATSWHAVVMGLLAAAGFSVSAVAFRGAILVLDSNNFLVAASFTLVVSLGCQTTLLAVWMRVKYPDVWKRCLAEWRASILGGFLGALASQGWFIGFALTSAANVRTLGLVEVLFAQAVSYKLFLARTSGRDWVGIGMILAGVATLLWVGAG